MDNFMKRNERQTLFKFMSDVVMQLERAGKCRTAEAYRSAMRSFMCFRDGRDLPLKDIDSDLIRLYEAYLRSRALTRNSSSFYMRILRAVYNRAVADGVVAQRLPFRHVYTGVDKTVKRAIPLDAVRRIKTLDLSHDTALDFARDMFLFSFYTRGMSFVDMAYLSKGDLSCGILAYCRRKTGQRLLIKWEGCMQDIVDKYDNHGSCYLLPIIGESADDGRKQYQSRLRLVNMKLKELASIVGVSVPLSTYVARHTWASVAKSKNIPLSVISEAMGHDSESTTRIYLTSFDDTVIDHANALIISDV